MLSNQILLLQTPNPNLLLLTQSHKTLRKRKPTNRKPLHPQDQNPQQKIPLRPPQKNPQEDYCLGQPRNPRAEFSLQPNCPGNRRKTIFSQIAREPQCRKIKEKNQIRNSRKNLRIRKTDRHDPSHQSRKII